MRVTVIGSGSGGNATLFEAGQTKLLVDAGLSLRKLRGRLGALGRPLESLDAVLVTHSHSDHWTHAERYAKRWDAPIYMTESCRRGMKFSGTPRTRIVGSDTSFRIKDIEVMPMSVPHDAPQVALVFHSHDDCVGLATDLGCVPVKLRKHFHNCRTLLFESNHDREMLNAGPYPRYIRERVLGDKGHLSNMQTAAFLRRLSPKTERVVLMHISESNNTPEKAYESAKKALRSKDVELLLASQHTPLVLPERVAQQLSLAL